MFFSFCFNLFAILVVKNTYIAFNGFCIKRVFSFVVILTKRVRPFVSIGSKSKTVNYPYGEKIPEIETFQNKLMEISNAKKFTTD